MWNPSAGLPNVPWTVSIAIQAEPLSLLAASLALTTIAGAALLLITSWVMRLHFWRHTGWILVASVLVACTPASIESGREVSLQVGPSEPGRTLYVPERSMERSEVGPEPIEPNTMRIGRRALYWGRLYQP